MTYIYYTLIPLLLLVTVVLLRKRGMKSKDHLPHCEDRGEIDVPDIYGPLFFPQEKSNPTKERN